MNEVINISDYYNPSEHRNHNNISVLIDLFEKDYGFEKCKKKLISTRRSIDTFYKKYMGLLNVSKALGSIGYEMEPKYLRKLIEDFDFDFNFHE